MAIGSSIPLPASPLNRVAWISEGAPDQAEPWMLGDPQVTFPRWDEWVLSQPGYSFFHTSAWLKVLQASYGYAALYLGLQSDSQGLRAALPLVEVRSWLTGQRGVSLPFTDECAPLVDSSASLELLITQALQLAKTRKWAYLEWRGASPFDPPRAASLSYYGHRVTLSANERAMFDRLDSATQRGVNKARKCGLAVEISTDWSALQSFYTLHGRTRKKHGQPVQPLAFFEAIHSQVLSQGNGCIITANLENRPVAASLFCYAGKRAIYKFGASDDRFLNYRGNNLVMWEAIRHFGQSGFDSLDLGRTSLEQEGLRRFKAGWGAEERAIRYFRFDLRKGQFVTLPDQAHRWHTAILRKMPVPVLILLGRFLYKHAA